MIQIDPKLAHNIIEKVSTSGQPPEYGLQYFTSGLEPYLSVLETKYLASDIRNGLSTFRLVVGAYGGGKTHFLYCVRDLAWKYNYATAYVSLSQDECPFSSLDAVYKAIVNSLTPPLSPDRLQSDYRRGIVPFINFWYENTLKRLQNTGLSGDEIKNELLKESYRYEGNDCLSFTQAVGEAFRVLIDNNKVAYREICQWLTGEMYVKKVYQPYGIFQKIDKTTAFSMIRSLLGWVRAIGYSGLV